MILMCCGGFGLAVFLSGMIGMRVIMEHARVAAANFVYAHLILLTFLLLGVRHLFSIPVELKANWAFQITEGEGRREWLHAVDRLVLFAGVTVILILPLPIEVYLLRWRAVAELILFTAFALLCYEWLFSSWEKLPFTCSHLPAKSPMWMRALQYWSHWAAALASAAFCLPVSGRLLGRSPAFWWRGSNHSSCKQGWRFACGEEELDPAVQSLNLLK
jgi:hypothetical protein